MPCERIVIRERKELGFCSDFIGCQDPDSIKDTSGCGRPWKAVEGLESLEEFGSHEPVVHLRSEVRIAKHPKVAPKRSKVEGRYSDFF